MKTFGTIIRILFQAPQIIDIVKTIMDIVGSAQVQNLLEAIRDALQKEVAKGGAPPKTEAEREGLFKRILQRRTFGNLGMSEGDYANFCDHQQERNYA
jgi:hypothetical protein